MTGDRVIRVKPAAEMLGIVPGTLRRWIVEGRVQAIRPGPRSTGILQSELDRLLRESVVRTPTTAV